MASMREEWVSRLTGYSNFFMLTVNYVGTIPDKRQFCPELVQQLAVVRAL